MKNNIASKLINDTRRDKLGENFNRIDLGVFYISIQAGKEFYSFPTTDFYTLDSYSKYEIAIFDRNGQWVIPHTDERLHSFEWVKLFEQDNHNPIAPFIDREKVEIIIQDLLSFAKRVMN